MLRTISALLLLGLLAGCVTAKNQPIQGVAERQAGDSVVVGSISTPRDANLGLYQARVVFLFFQYDPATNRLLPDGDSFQLERATCLFSSGGDCDFTQPAHQVVTVAPGHYVLAQTTIYAGNRWTDFYYVPFDRDWWSSQIRPDAALAEVRSIRVEVRPRETLYFGQVRLAHTGKTPGEPGYTQTLMEMTVEQRDDLAAAALAAAGLPAGDLVYRAATP